MSLRYKILLPAILLIILIVSATVFLSYQKTSEALRESLYDNMQRQASTLVASTVAFSSDFINMAAQTADRPDVRDILDGNYLDPAKVEASNQLLARLKGFYSDCDRMAVLDFMGSIVASSNPDVLGQDLSNEEFFIQVMQSGKTYRAPAGKDAATGDITMVAAAPILSGGNIIGVMVCVITLEGYYNRYVAQVSIGESGYAYVLNSRAEVLAHRDQSLLFNPDIPLTPMHQRMVNNRRGVEEYIDPQGKRIIAYYTSDTPTRTTTVIQAEYDDVFEALGEIRNRSIVLALAAILIGAAVFLCIVTPITRALNHGMRFAMDVASGKLDGTLKVQRDDELGKLADALRAIPISLRSVIAEYRTLEGRIRFGELDALGDSGKFQGEFASLVEETNCILRRFHSVLDSIPLPVIMTDKDCKSAYANRTARESLTPACTGKSCEQIYMGQEADGDRCGLIKAVQEKRPVQTEMQISIQGRDKELLHTSIPMFTQSGKLESVLLLTMDLTEVKEAQRAVLSLAQQAGHVADDTFAASEELAVRIEQVRRGTVTQRERADATAVAMEEMNATMIEVARSTSGASQQADTTRQRAEMGDDLVSRVLASVNEVNAVAHDLRQSMQELGAQADGIGGVMTVIADIADQTNLLALNAAIEAARAGETGRGFAVVADEVRKLAEKTMQATNEVGRSIRGIQGAAGDNIAKVGKVSENAEQAAELAADSGRTLRDIVSLAQTSSALITNIAAAVEEQSATLEEITRAMDAINTVANETSTGMEYSADAVQALTRKAHGLKGILDKLG